MRERFVDAEGCVEELPILVVEEQVAEVVVRIGEGSVIVSNTPSTAWVSGSTATS